MKQLIRSLLISRLAFLLGLSLLLFIPFRHTAKQTKPDAFVSTKAGEERTVNSVKLVWCPPGRFRMGSPPNEVKRRYDEAQVDVTLTNGFWMGKYEVTQGQWQRLMGAFMQPQHKGAGEDFPVYWVSYIEAEEFCRKLTAQAHASGALPAGWEFRLPTEAQWEYACRAGTTTATAFGDKLSNLQKNLSKSLTTEPKRLRHSSRQQRSAVILPTLGACTICMGMFGSIAGIGITDNCRAVLILTCRR